MFRLRSIITIKKPKNENNNNLAIEFTIKYFSVDYSDCVFCADRNFRFRLRGRSRLSVKPNKMKKNKATDLNAIAEALPRIFEWKLGVEEFTGIELNLSGFGEERKFDNGSMYEVEVPFMQALDHKQQLKDAYKRGGNEAVIKYVNAVYRREAECEAV